MRRPSDSQERALSLLGGLCFFLSALEYLIPKPLPFIRLGLANLPLLFAVDILTFPSYMLLVAVKIAGQALVSGTLFSYVFLFSLGGTGISALIMYALRRAGKDRISLAGISCAGALASNGAQLALAYYFIFGNSIRYMAAPVLALGTVTGTLLGIVAGYFRKRSLWYAKAVSGTLTEEKTIHVPAGAGIENKPERSVNRRESFYNRTFGSAELAVAGLCMMPALLLNGDTPTRTGQFLFFWLLAGLSGKKNNPLVTLAVMTGIVFFNLLVPYGEILFSAGPLEITSGALEGGIRRAVTLEGLFMLSRFSVRKDLALPGRFGTIAGESFRVFSVMAGAKGLFTPRNWTERLDNLLLSFEVETNGNNTPALPEEQHSTTRKPYGKAGKIILAGAVLLAWLPLLF
jgi:heptaprenyl diphosphate synthase